MMRLATMLVCLLLCSGVVADERILAFHSNIRILEDGSMEVLETIRVRAEGRQIRRGIFRDFPTDYRDRLGNRVRVGFDLQGVTRDGVAEAHHTQRRSNGVRIYIGEREVLLPPGEYEYGLRYRVTQMLGFFSDHDELYWNVTGNGWRFAIDTASADIRLPAAVTAADVRIEGYTGRSGSKDQHYVASVDDSAVAHIRTTRSLAPRQGLTVVVAWPKGYVAEPTILDELVVLLRNNSGLAIALGSAIVSILYLFVAWHRVGRDPPAGVIFPHYAPPEGYSPASIRYVSKLGYDKRAFTVAVLNLAVQGFLRIDKTGKKYTLQRTAKSKSQAMAPGEAAVLSKMFASGERVLLDNANHSVVGGAMREHEKMLRKYHHKRYFVTNGLFLMPSILMLLGALLAIAVLDALTLSVGVVLASSALVLAVFAYLLKAPTMLGRKLLDRVAGFKMYLEVAEKDELELRNPPDQTPELFEAYLPYALALGVEQRWAEQFAGVFRRLRDEHGTDYHPAWYVGGDWNASDPVRFADTVGDSLNSAISSAATAPGSSSGGGGGGFSGGGGGGGGGGGW